MGLFFTQWSELYAFIKLLKEGKVYAADENVERIDNVYFPIIKLIREEETDEVTDYHTGSKIKIYKADEADKYFEVVSVEKIAIPETAYTTISDLPKEGFYVENGMTKMQMVLKDDSVNGSLRKGDIVDVYVKDPAAEMLTLMEENVYVSEVYNTAGKKITEDDEVATSFTVWVTPEEVESINTAVVYGGIQMYLKTE